MPRAGHCKTPPPNKSQFFIAYPGRLAPDGSRIVLHGVWYGPAIL